MHDDDVDHENLEILPLLQDSKVPHKIFGVPGRTKGPDPILHPQEQQGDGQESNHGHTIEKF